MIWVITIYVFVFVALFIGRTVFIRKKCNDLFDDWSRRPYCDSSTIIDDINRRFLKKVLINVSLCLVWPISVPLISANKLYNSINDNIFNKFNNWLFDKFVLPLLKEVDREKDNG